MRDSLVDSGFDRLQLRSCEIQHGAGRRPGIHDRPIFRRLADGKSDDVYRLIATERLFVDLHVAALAEPARVRVDQIGQAGLDCEHGRWELDRGERPPSRPPSGCRH